MTLKDVAEESGVSTATVSHVINGTRYVSEEVKSRVLKVIDRLEYYPDARARNLARHQSNIVALILPSMEGLFFAELSSVIENQAIELGYNLIVANTYGDPEKEIDHMNLAWTRQADGVILISSTFEAPSLKSFVRNGMKVVLVDSIVSPDVVSELKISAVYSDNYKGAYQATMHLIEKGHTSIDCISGPVGSPGGEQRLKGFREAMEDYKLPMGKILQGDYKYASGRVAALRLLEKGLPSAIFALNDEMALGAMWALQSHGLSVPEDISVVGFDDIRPSKYTQPPLTTVHQDTGEMGRIACKLLIEEIEEKTDQERQVVLPAHLIERGSTALA